MTLADILCPSCALFLDFDGTLVDLAHQPDAVVVPARLVRTLEGINQYLGGAVAVVTGRPIGQVDAFLSPLRLPVAGVHGAERRGADGELTLMYTHSMKKVEDAVLGLVARHPALLIEGKRGSIALHYRQAPQLEQLCLDTMQAAIEDSPGLTLLRGKMVVEAKPSGASKGSAIENYLQEAPFMGRTPVFIGDDITDEVGFAAVQRLGGLGVKVGEGATVAWQRLATPAALRDALETALQAKTSRSTA